MLQAIASAPIVSTDTLRPDHLCSALISEADRLGITLGRDLWQPAAAIAAHGRKPGGICLDLPPRLQEISGEIIAELFDVLNWAAPSGCFLGSSEGDGACFLWRLTMEAQVEAINGDPSSRWEAKTLTIPEHWLPAIVNCDDSSFDYSGDAIEYCAFLHFCQEELSDGWDLTGWEEESSFCSDHDASAYGALAGNVTECLLTRRKPCQDGTVEPIMAE